MQAEGPMEVRGQAAGRAPVAARLPAAHRRSASLSSLSDASGGFSVADTLCTSEAK